MQTNNIRPVQTGNGCIDVGSYGTLRGTVEINHIDGSWLDIFVVNDNTIEVRDHAQTSYF
jgi:hypothetical protein